MEKIYRGMANGAETIDRNFNNGYGQKVGDIHISIDSSNPSTRFGGTWERFANGRTLVGVDESDSVQLMKTSNQNGGSKNPLTSHDHSFSGTTSGTPIVEGTTSNPDIRFQGSTSGSGLKSATHTHAFNGITKKNGDNTNYNNWQPFITVYMWVRTA